MTRAEQCAELRSAIAAAFPDWEVSTNESCNPGTPLAVTITTATRTTKVYRAGSVRTDFDQFKRDALAFFSAWKARVFGPQAA